MDLIQNPRCELQTNKLNVGNELCIFSIVNLPNKSLSRIVTRGTRICADLLHTCATQHVLLWYLLCGVLNLCYFEVGFLKLDSLWRWTQEHCLTNICMQGWITKVMGHLGLKWICYTDGAKSNLRKTCFTRVASVVRWMNAHSVWITRRSGLALPNKDGENEVRYRFWAHSSVPVCLWATVHQNKRAELDLSFRPSEPSITSLNSRPIWFKVNSPNCYYSGWD